MLDQKNRQKAASLVRSLLEGRIDTDEFEDQFPKSKDVALENIYLALWGYWDDPLFRSGDSLKGGLEKGQGLIARCVLFLESPLEYECEPVKTTSRIRTAFHRLTGNGVQVCDAESWPFQSREQYQQAAAAQAMDTGLRFESEKKN